ncbi:S1 RNA-binding domain-containing protein [Sporosarcina pasteurii]|uniref:Conserved virulence factor B n=1 Tax=Sporosarcina pasteurii TaxID=1474 RepID=A0A380CIU7_SPOPA|nr:S1-like domain-containing RNA-binding protein [Sporosarcina pasteurii]MDS9472151.1 S1-like domain-containing RNA-binding protein [Sporosarcina pasteurii]QBQ06864.1 DNA-binding protein [Sporosarcina pasteurii]SUJ20351.1 Conserved virulence factor B [Sporosarcina pasteurii]
MTQLQSGSVVELEIIDQEGSRWVLKGNEENIMMNVSDADEDVQVGDIVSVFLYMNRRKELTATMRMPNMTIGTFGWAKVIRSEANEGVYVDIGSSFEVLVNGADLPQIKKLWPQPGDELYMTLRTDLGGGIFGRLATEERVLERIATAEPSLFNANVTARAYRLLPVGSFMLTIPENYRVFVHESEQKAEPRLGEEVTVRIIDVHSDGTLNGSMLPRVEERLSGDAEVIFTYLTDVGGKMPFTDKSSPEEIREMFNMSKGSFKRALGRLMRERKVIQEDGWTKVTGE